MAVAYVSVPFAREAGCPVPPVYWALGSGQGGHRGLSLRSSSLHSEAFPFDHSCGESLVWAHAPCLGSLSSHSWPPLYSLPHLGSFLASLPRPVTLIPKGVTGISYEGSHWHFVC